MGRLRGLRFLSAAPTLLLAIASPAIAYHKRVYVPVQPVVAQAPTAVVAQVPTTYFLQAPTPYVAQAPAQTYVAQAPQTYIAQAPVSPNVAQAPTTYVAQAPATFPTQAAAPAAGQAPAGAGETATLSPTLRAALLSDLRGVYARSARDAGAADSSLAERIKSLRETARERYATLLGDNDEELGRNAQDDIDQLVDHVVGGELNRPVRPGNPYSGGAPGYGTAVVPIVYPYPVAAAPSLFIVQPVTPVPLVAPVLYRHPLYGLFHPNR